MTKRGWGVWGLWLLVAGMLLTGCAAGGDSRGTEYSGASINNEPPALRGTPPALSQWYTPPYFDPYESP